MYIEMGMDKGCSFFVGICFLTPISVLLMLADVNILVIVCKLKAAENPELS